jgi:hypothetical protein
MRSMQWEPSKKQWVYKLVSQNLIYKPNISLSTRLSQPEKISTVNGREQKVVFKSRSSGIHI